MARIFAVGNVLIAGMLTVVLLRFELRSWMAEVGAGLLIGLLLVSAFGLLTASRWGMVAVRACAWTGLAVALCGAAALGLSALEFGADHALGEDGLPRSVLAVALLLPYLLLYPAVQLLWVHRRPRFAEPS